MGFKDQWNKIKDNWLLILIGLIVLVFLMGSSGGGIGLDSMSRSMQVSEMAYDIGYEPNAKYSSNEADFAPQEEERKIVKTSNMGIQTERGEFKEAENKLMNIVSSSDSYLLNSNAQASGVGKRSYMSGSYSIKVDTTKYDSVVAQLKEIGEVTSFSENARDITGSYTNTQIEIDTEKTRLKRYEELYEGSYSINDKLTLTDKIYNQERRIKYLEDSLTNMDARIEYSTVSVRISEQRSDYINVAFAKFSDLVESMVGGINVMLYILFVALPYAIVGLFIWWIIRVIRRRNIPKAP